jgi:hypothetical protein
MACRDFSVRSVNADDAATLVRRSILARRMRGHKNESAIEDAAYGLGLTVRRAKSLLYGEVFKVAGDEYKRLLHRWRADIDQQAAELTAMAIKIEKEADLEWSAEHQLSLPLDEVLSGPPANRSASGGGATGSEKIR